ncbi:MAG TPA: hypothetical protein VGK63_03565 [Candidatus Limnocylindrales bacterium]
MTSARLRRTVNVVLAVALVAVALAVGWTIVDGNRTSGSPRPSGGPTTAASGSGSPGPTNLAPPVVAAFRGPAWPVSSVHRPLDDRGAARVWSAAGTWWAILLAANGEWHICRLDATAQAWVDTGTLVDARRSARADAVWDGTALLVASAVEDGGSDDAILVTRFSYRADIKRFVLDADFPIAVAHGPARAWIDRDPAGRLWLALLSAGSVRVAHSTGDDHDWSSAVPLGPAGGMVTAVAVASSATTLAVAYAVQDERALHVATPKADGTWNEDKLEIAGATAGAVELEATMLAGDRLAVGARLSSDGAAALAPGLVVAVRSADGAWRQAVADRIKDHAGSFALVPTGGGEVTLVSTPSNTGGWLLAKSSPAATLAFESGPGTPILAGSLDGDLRDPVVARRAPDDGQALVLAADDTSGDYFHLLFAPAGAALPASRPGPGGPRPDRLPPAPSVLVDDTFESFTSDPTGSAWTIDARSTIAGQLGLSRDGDDTRLDLVRSATTGELRACRELPPTASGTVRLAFVVSLAALGDSDATVASVRGPGGEIASVRFTRDGEIAYYAAAAKITTTRAIRLGQAYRIVIMTNPANDRFSLSVRATSGGAVLRRTAIPARTPGIREVDRACVETPLGGAMNGLQVSSLRVERP